jgi:hypothetical protein
MDHGKSPIRYPLPRTLYQSPGLINEPDPYTENLTVPRLARALKNTAGDLPQGRGRMTRPEDRQTLMYGIVQARTAGARLAPLVTWSAWMLARCSAGTPAIAERRRIAGAIPITPRRRTR